MNFKSKKAALLLALTGLFVGCAPEYKNAESFIAQDSKVTSNVVYGTDGRLDVYQLTDDRLHKLAESTVALVKSTDLVPSGNGQITIKGKNFGINMNLCSSERFREQDTAAFCSGSLVGPDLILTAGHCIEALADCQATSLVFGFAVKSVGQLPKQIQASEIYKCKEIVKTIRNNAGQDFAIIRLDKPVTGHAVLQLRQTGELSVGEELVVIGHPVGLPTKVTTGGKVRNISNSEFIVASVDTYGGNSGSAVFNAKSGLIEGILVRGEQDFIRQGSCSVTYTCSEDSCRGEDITRISMARSYIPNSGGNITEPPTAPTLKPEIFTSIANLQIPDNNPQGILSTLQVSSLPQGRKVFITLDVAHPYIGDLLIQAIAPDGKSVIIHSRAGARTENLKKSYDVTSALGKVSSSGIYKLIVKDLASQDLGSLKSWAVEFR